MNQILPKNTSICDMDDQWAGRNILRDAFLKSEMGWSFKWKKGAATLSIDAGSSLPRIYGPDIPVKWALDTPETYHRQYFSQEVAEKGAKLVEAFLKANDVNVVNEHLSYYVMNGDEPWGDADKVVVGTNGTNDPYASNPSSIMMLPHMRRPLWNLVRYPYEEYEF